MLQQKTQYVEKIFTLVMTSCQQLAPKATPEAEASVLALKMSKNDVKEVIKKIVIALPNQLFLNKNPSALDDILCFISKEFILFQSQEDIESPAYALNLINFINYLVADIHNLN